MARPQISVQRVATMGEVEYKLVNDQGRSIRIIADGTKSAGYSYTIRGVKSWTYPKYAIEYAVKRLGGRSRIVGASVKANKSYQIWNLTSVLGTSGTGMTDQLEEMWKLQSKKRTKKTKTSTRKPSAPRKMKPITIRGKVYRHHKTHTTVGGANTDKANLQSKGFTVLVRNYGSGKIHVYKGPKRRK